MIASEGVKQLGHVGSAGGLGALCRRLRERAGLTQAELASRLGYRDQGGQSAIGQIERGEPTLHTLRRVARVCGFRIRLEVEAIGRRAE